MLLPVWLTQHVDSELSEFEGCGWSVPCSEAVRGFLHFWEKPGMLRLIATARSSELSEFAQGEEEEGGSEGGNEESVRL